MSGRYTSREMKIKTLRVLAVILAVAFLVSAALFGISLWERYNGNFLGTDSDSLEDSIQFDGKEYVLKENLETFLVLGLDKFDEENLESYNNDKQSDFLMLLVIDNDSKSFSALHINRDTMVEIDVLGVAGDKIGTTKKQLALAHTYGSGKEVSCRNVAKSVSRLLKNADVDHYASVTMDAVPIFNDLVGGVEVTVLDDFSGIDDTLKKGEKTVLMGEHALSYVRTRYGLDDSTNNSRMKRQKQYMDALYDKTLQQIKADDSFIGNAFLKLNPYIVSDCSANRLEALMKKLSEYKFDDMYDIEGKLTKGKKFMEFYPNEDSVEEITVKLFYELKK